MIFFPIAPNARAQEDVLFYWENFFSSDEINKILAFPEWLQTTQAKIGIDNGVVDSDKRRTQIAWLHMSENTHWVYERISETISKVNGMHYQYDLSGMHESIQLGVYSELEQGHYDWHVDAGGSGIPRKLSMALLLSDPSEFEGGQLQVKLNSDEAIDVEQRKGRAWFFPAYALHRVTPVTKGIRRSLVIWAGGPKFK